MSDSFDPLAVINSTPLATRQGVGSPSKDVSSSDPIIFSLSLMQDSLETVATVVEDLETISVSDLENLFKSYFVSKKDLSEAIVEALSKQISSVRDNSLLIRHQSRAVELNREKQVRDRTSTTVQKDSRSTSSSSSHSFEKDYNGFLSGLREITKNPLSLIDKIAELPFKALDGLKGKSSKRKEESFYGESERRSSEDSFGFNRQEPVFASLQRTPTFDSGTPMTSPQDSSFFGSFADLFSGSFEGLFNNDLTSNEKDLPLEAAESGIKADNLLFDTFDEPEKSSFGGFLQNSIFGTSQTGSGVAPTGLFGILASLGLLWAINNLDKVKAGFETIKTIFGMIGDTFAGAGVTFELPTADELYRARMWGIPGAIVGGSIGGVKGALIGLALGVAGGVLFNRFINSVGTDAEGNTAWWVGPLEEALPMALGGASIGWMVGGLPGALLGAMIGAGVGIFKHFSKDENRDSWYEIPDSVKIGGAAIMGAVSGAVIGAKFGGLIGAVIGALVGGGIGAFAAWMTANRDRENMEFAEAQENVLRELGFSEEDIAEANSWSYRDANGLGVMDTADGSFLNTPISGGARESLLSLGIMESHGVLGSGGATSLSEGASERALFEQLSERGLLNSDEPFVLTSGGLFTKVDPSAIVSNTARNRTLRVGDDVVEFDQVPEFFRLDLGGERVGTFEVPIWVPKNKMPGGRVTGGNARSWLSSREGSLFPLSLDSFSTDRWSGEPNLNVSDAIITSDGQVIHTHPDDNIYAFKGDVSINPLNPSRPYNGGIYSGSSDPSGSNGSGTVNNYYNTSNYDMTGLSPYSEFCPVGV